MDVSLLGRMEDQKTKGAAVAPPPPAKFEWWALDSCLYFAFVSFFDRPLTCDAIKSAMLWCSAAGPGPALLLKFKGRRRARLALACVGLAAAVVDHCIATWLMGLMLVAAQEDSHFLFLCLFVAACAIFFAVVDLLSFRALLRGIGEEESGRPRAGASVRVQPVHHL
ncbi:hypothetical protein PVAP13_2KG410700 [Panicum virgatum]|uniref:Uncharacterized protein n=1 Tax=Panicum virgatum TaxID=38727 RepID=A0A8T0WAF0_PANVG|nr:hypothetical protein PVAP13_2KG410700 [Panicum virgatum]